MPNNLTESLVDYVSQDPVLLQLRLDELNPDGWSLVSVVPSQGTVSGVGQQPVWIIVLQRSVKS